MTGRRQAQLVFIVSALVFLVFTIAGCDKQTRPNESPGKTSTDAGDSEKSDQKGLSKDKNSGDAPAPTESVQLALYFSDDQAEKLVRETRTIPATDTVASAAVRELIAGPKKGGEPTIPSGTRLLSVTIEEGVASVNFSKELVDNHPGGSAGEKLTVYSVVNTLTEFNTIQEVRFLVEGAVVDTIAGHMDLSEPVGRDESLL